MARTLSTITFRAGLCRPADGGDWTFLRLPKEASDQVPTRNTKFAGGTINGFPFQAFLQPDSEGGHWLRLEPEVTAAAGVAAGDEVELDITPLDFEPEPEVPEDLRIALAASPKASAVWAVTTTAARRDWIQWLTSGKKAETRIIRLNKMIDMLGHGKRRICCYDRSGMASKAFTCPTPAPETDFQ